MSLINDALKRTKDAQQQNPPPAGGPPMKPADPAEVKTASNAKTLLYIMVACVVFGNALLFIAVSGKKAKPPTTASVVAPTPVAAPPTTPAPAVAPTVPVAPEPAKVQPTPAVVAPVAVATNATVEQAATVAQLEPPKPAPLKLQSIIFNAARSSAMISGKFVLVGDKVQGFRVTAIDQGTVTLVGNGQTNVLSLP